MMRSTAQTNKAQSSRARSTRAPKPTLTLLMCLLSAPLSSACEDTTIYATPEPSAPVRAVEPLSASLCELDEDCPQWRCVEGLCVEGRCELSRRSGAFDELRELPAPSAQSRLVSAQWSASQAGGEAEMTSPPALFTLLSSNAEGGGERLVSYELDEGRWLPKTNQTLSQPSAAFCVSDEGALATIEGDAQRALRVRSLAQTPESPERPERPEQLGLEVALSAQGNSCTFSEEGVWVSVHDKGLELINPALAREGEASPRFDTPGRALGVSLGLSVAVVADGFAGVSLFSKRTVNLDEPSSLNRALITPPLERETSGRVVEVDTLEGHLLAAEWGAGVSLWTINPASGLELKSRAHLGGEVRGVSFIDPYTALVWVEGRGALALDLTPSLSAGEPPVVLAELRVGEGEEAWAGWRASRGWLVGWRGEGQGQVSAYLCE